MAQTPVIVLNQNTQREQGHKAQIANITAAKAVADIIRTTLGPRSMLKMLLDPMGGIVITNDGNAILREINVKHPAAKSMIELSRAQDEEVGDGTTSVIILAGEVLAVAQPLLNRKMHPTTITAGFYDALQSAVKACEGVCKVVDIHNREEFASVVRSCIGTKFINRFGQQMVDLALDAVMTVAREVHGSPEVDIKRYAKIEKIPGGEIEDSRVLKGVMINKDVVHPKMKRFLRNPRILLLDCPLEYKKGESQTNLEISGETDFEAILRAEEEFVKKQCDAIIAIKPDVVITEKGISDVAAHFLAKAGISALRRMRKTDNNRVARASGATIVGRTEDLREDHLGTACGLFEVTKIGDEYFSFFVDCKEPKACTVLLRGANKDVLNEVERNMLDAMAVARNVVLDPKLLPGGGATEMAISAVLRNEAKSLEGLKKQPFLAIAEALEVIPRTLAQNCGASVIRVITALRAKHAVAGHSSWGVDGDAGVVTDMNDLGVWEPAAVKIQTLKTAIESACMLLRIDDVVSGVSRKDGAKSAPPPKPDDDGNGNDPEAAFDNA
jgi:T-complex protein 1 subunit gamma